MGRAWISFWTLQGDLAGEGFDALAPKAHWLVFGGQAGAANPLPPDRLWAMIGKNLTLRGYNVSGSNAADFARGVKEMIGWAVGGQLKISVQRFPLADAARAQQAISSRQTTGKVVLEP